MTKTHTYMYIFKFVQRFYGSLQEVTKSFFMKLTCNLLWLLSLFEEILSLLVLFLFPLGAVRDFPLSFINIKTITVIFLKRLSFIL